MKTGENTPQFDAVLIGAGIMSSTLGVLLKELEPDWRIMIYERLDRVAAESSDAWNNAGTGHSGLCELNYSPQKPDGTVDVSKAEKIAGMFEVSKQFWAYLATKGFFGAPHDFINSCPHMSLVIGEEGVKYLRQRYEAMRSRHIFSGILYSDDHAQLQEWIPLVMEGRSPDEEIAATRIETGTDVNFGVLTRNLVNHLTAKENVTLCLHTEVHHLHQDEDGSWLVESKNLETGAHALVRAKFVFIGAGGGSLPLLEKSKIEEGAGFAGFPVSGQWLKCNNKAVIARHHAKVYGRPAQGSPPMSSPHLDTRVIDGEKELLFGPYAGFSTKFLKEGSYLDLPLSLRLNNILSMFGAGIHNVALTEYLVKQVFQSADDRFEALKTFMPDAEMQDWELVHAGQRVQVIKRDAKQGGILEFGTEIVSHADGSIAALLGASPGASTSVSIMLDLLHTCFKDKLASPAWQAKMLEMIPTYGRNLAEEGTLCTQTRAWTHAVLDLHLPEGYEER